VEATVVPAVRETVEAVDRIDARGKAEFGGWPNVAIAQLAEYLKLDRSTVNRGARVAVHLGYLTNVTAHMRSRKALLKLGEPMPEDEEVLPT